MRNPLRVHNTGTAVRCLSLVRGEVGLYPDGGLDQLQCDMVLEAYADLDAQLRPQWCASAAAVAAGDDRGAAREARCWALAKRETRRRKRLASRTFGRPFHLGVLRFDCAGGLGGRAADDLSRYGAAMGRSPTSGRAPVPLSAAQRAEVARSLNRDALPTMLARIERVLRDAADDDGAARPRPPQPPQPQGGPWFCGVRLTICDLSSAVVVGGLLDGSYAGEAIDGAAVLADCPRLRAHAARVAALPAVRRWRSVASASSSS